MMTGFVKILLLFFLLLLVTLGVIFFQALRQIGEAPSGALLEKIRASKQFDNQQQIFRNTEPPPKRKDGAKNRLKAGARKMNMMGALKFFLNNEGKTVPERRLPEIKPPDLDAFLTPGEGIKYIWFGHSTILLNIGGTIILIDPVFSTRASPLPFFVKRFQPPILTVDALPPVDYVLISHDHYDHLDMKTIKRLAKKEVKFILPLGVTSHLQKWGVDEARMVELDWNESVLLSGIEFICTESRHFSGRSLDDGNKTLWASWVIGGGDRRIFFSGDSGYGAHFAKIGKKYGPFDLSFIDSGQYNERWPQSHNFPEQALEAAFDLKSARMMPIHWAMFRLSTHDWFAPIEKLIGHNETRNKGRDKKSAMTIFHPKIGQLVYLDGENSFERWWRER